MKRLARLPAPRLGGRRLALGAGGAELHDGAVGLVDEVLQRLVLAEALRRGRPGGADARPELGAAA